LKPHRSVLHGTEQDGSDHDLLVNTLPGATLFDPGGLQDELEALLGVRVDLLTPADLPPKVRARVPASTHTHRPQFLSERSGH